ncbi:MAG: UvrD-helicase domain-containing protein, partial [Clostridia bacterium]|nr:UvrD-helicase domain-containing protein [Clostridia bacterium]
MKKINWNKQQENAITFENCNIIVSAGAGSGKTAVLTERITRLVESGESILNFAVCTFSRAAAEEMKERIRNALLERGLEKEADDAFLADINTMHALMSKVLESHFDVLNLPPKFNILEKPDVLMEQAMNNTLNMLFEDNEFKSFAMLVSPKNDETLKELIKTVFKFCCNISNYEEFLEKNLQNAREGNVKPLEKEYCALIKDKVKEFTNAYEMLLSKSYLEQKETNALEKDLAILYSLLEGVEKNELPHLDGFKTFPPKQPNKDEIYLIREPAKELVNSAREFKELLENEEIVKSDAHNLEMLIKAVTTFDREFAKIKLDNGVLTFNDLERYAYKILQNDKIAEEYRNRYKYILVDEYQDTSRLQQDIIDKLRGDKNLFMVGDIKQSIYRFRHADPTLFYKTYNEYDTDGDNVRIDLSVNYRSKKNILSFVNGVFSVLLNEGKEYYPKEAFLKTEDKDDMHCVDIDIVAADKNETDDIEALQIVKRIEEMLTKKDGEADSRTYEPKDIAVLFRSVKQSDSTAAIVYRMLKDKGIAVQLSDTENNLFRETAVFLDFMSLIDNAENDIPLLSVMYSEIGRFSIDDIIEIRRDKKISFYECVKNYKGDKSLEERISAFMQMLDELALQSRGLTVDELMAVALTKTGYLKILEKTKDSGAKAGQIYQIIDAAKSYEQMGYYGISGFVEYAESLKQLKSGIETEGFVQSGNAVSIMTMHKSKGLEFPVVIVGGLGKEIKGNTNQTGGKQCEMHKYYGIGMAFFNSEKHCKVIPPKMKLLELHNKKEDLEESMRLFYVAMTRAKERLFLVGSVKDKDLEIWKSKDESVLEPKT